MCTALSVGVWAEGGYAKIDKKSLFCPWRDPRLIRDIKIIKSYKFMYSPPGYTVQGEAGQTGLHM